MTRNDPWEPTNPGEGLTPRVGEDLTGGVENWEDEYQVEGPPQVPENPAEGAVCQKAGEPKEAKDHEGKSV